MNTDDYRRRLLVKEKELLAGIERATANARDMGGEAVRDVADDSVADEVEAEQFTEAEADGVVLTQVRDALRRIDEGFFGTCVVDGGPIELKRLEAAPWTPYCLKHQQLREASTESRMPTM
jgi:DnaK suppressor protein